MRSSWYTDAVIYQLDPRLYVDSDDDGWGDLLGVVERLHYLRGLGVTCVWLLPFYVSPFRDGGYDVADHLAVDPRLGDLADVARLLETAEDLGLHVLVELVTQHTSDRHPWFQEARRHRDSPYRGYYVWSDEPRDDIEPMFPDVEPDTWTWDEEAQQFYRHGFYSHEPDLALDNPRVRDELHRIVSFWLRMGVSGFRVDAVPLMLERARAARPDTNGQWLMRDLQAAVSAQRAGAVLLGEVDVEPDSYADYFGAEGEHGMTMLLDFWTNNHLFLALARGRAEPLERALRVQPAPPSGGTYVHWLRNNDELDLEQLSPEERREVLDAFAPEESMRIYGRGMRRRLAPMLGGDPRRLALAHAVLFSLPGPPVLRYGDEIGMGDDLDRPEREAVRTPMQWSATPSAGFSGAPPDTFPAPVITGPYGPDRVNVDEQNVRDGSLLRRVGGLVRAHLGMSELGRVRPVPCDVGAPSVLALRYEVEESGVLLLSNLADEGVDATLPDEEVSALREGAARYVDVHVDQDYSPVGADGRIRLAGYGYRWLRRSADGGAGGVDVGPGGGREGARGVRGAEHGPGGERGDDA
ncbi:alpha-amylase family protein [Myceligenerans pegani]|uniref:Alpha-amylase family protein n=1 Tax=Myceligenerans pegani TaxID=2776917 RepID=A0ABR9N6B4_9MICO|nr:alpha-amylase family protein [Myceligenerans sp. TRM 65318]MBE1878920.1 alpha-amylase family protein [Myceligenerans sp. TRM 65318]MBE3021191.1 alpha-amylase family protein [Myceligenerans sp. TRM 65318]